MKLDQWVSLASVGFTQLLLSVSQDCHNLTVTAGKPRWEQTVRSTDNQLLSRFSSGDPITASKEQQFYKKVDNKMASGFKGAADRNNSPERGDCLRDNVQ